MHSVYTTFIVNKDVHGQTQLIAMKFVVVVFGHPLQIVVVDVFMTFSQMTSQTGHSLISRLIAAQ